MHSIFAAILLGLVCLNPKPLGMFTIYAYAPQAGGINGGGKMANGMTPSIDIDGLFVACDRRYPFGTRFVIQGYDKVVTCGDRGGAIRGKVLDLLVVGHTAADAKQRALSWGKRHRQVSVCDD